MVFSKGLYFTAILINTIVSNPIGGSECLLLRHGWNDRLSVWSFSWFDLQYLKLRLSLPFFASHDCRRFSICPNSNITLRLAGIALDLLPRFHRIWPYLRWDASFFIFLSVKIATRISKELCTYHTLYCMDSSKWANQDYGIFI